MADAVFNLNEITMTQLITFLALNFMLGVTHAAEVQEGAFPEPNYLGILMSLVLLVGSSVWIFRQIMGNKNKQDKKDKQAGHIHDKQPK